MDMAIVGVFFACAAVLLSRRLGLDHRMAWAPLWASVLLFTIGLALPLAGAAGRAMDVTSYAVGGHACTLLGGVMLFAACAAFRPRDEDA